MGFDYGAPFSSTSPVASQAHSSSFFIFYITFSAIFFHAFCLWFCLLRWAWGSLQRPNTLGSSSYHDVSGKAIELSDQPPMVVLLGFFAGFAFFTAFSLSAAMNMLANRVLSLAELNEAVTALNDRLNALYAMTQAIGSKQHLNQVLNIVTSELARVMEVQAISVKLLTEWNLRFTRPTACPPI
jgi:hypothetical protein